MVFHEILVAILVSAEASLEGGSRDVGSHRPSRLSSDWKDGFQPPSPHGEVTSQVRSGTFFDTQLKLHTDVVLWRFALGAVYGARGEAEPWLVVRKVHWWNVVPERELTLDITTPVGVRLRYALWNIFGEPAAWLSFEYTESRYEVVERRYVGVDIYGGVNQARLVDSTPVDSGRSQRFQISLDLEPILVPEESWGLAFTLGYSVHLFQEYIGEIVQTGGGLSFRLGTGIGRRPRARYYE